MYKNIILRSGRERSIINRHPWIFSGAVKTMPAAAEGEIVAVRTNNMDLLGYGFFSSESQIVCRLFEFGKEEKNIDQDYWTRKIERAYTLRKEEVIRSNTNCYRLLHAEGDFLPGIIADVYHETASVQILIKGTELIKDMLIAAIMQVSGAQHVFMKTKKSSRIIENINTSNAWIHAPENAENICLENGLRFKVDVENGQKTGFFIDQRDNRQLLRQQSQGKKVLNTFSYTGGFSVYALAGGASLVHSVDISKEACRLCDENIALNFPGANHQSFAEDSFSFLKNMEEQYDIVVLDPPAFAKNARAVNNAARGYKELNLAAIRKIRSGGLIYTFSCSQNIDRDLFRKIVFSAAADAQRNVRIIAQFTQPADHPVNIYHPEGEYLKGLLLQVE